MLACSSTRACVEHASLYMSPNGPLPAEFAFVQACPSVTSCPSAAGLQAAAGGSRDVRVCAGHLCPAAGRKLPLARHATPGQPLLCLPCPTWNSCPGTAVAPVAHEARRGECPPASQRRSALSRGLLLAVKVCCTAAVDPPYASEQGKSNVQRQHDMLRSSNSLMSTSAVSY